MLIWAEYEKLRAELARLAPSRTCPSLEVLAEEARRDPRRTLLETIVRHRAELR